MILGCAAPSRPPLQGPLTEAASPCRGTRFDADAPDPRCLVPFGEIATPPARALAIGTLPSPAVVHSGRTESIVLELRNVSPAPLPLDLHSSCVAFDTVAKNTTVSSFESECGGLCGHSATKLHVLLEPGGIIHKRVQLRATRRTIAGDGCEEKDHGPLPPGLYTLEVVLPWSDPSPIPGNPEAHAARTFKGPLRIEP